MYYIIILAHILAHEGFYFPSYSFAKFWYEQVLVEKNT